MSRGGRVGRNTGNLDENRRTAPGFSYIVGTGEGCSNRQSFFPGVCPVITSRLRTLRDHIRWAVSRFHGEELFFGHGTDNAWDEARQLVLGALHLPWEMADSYLDC